MSNKVKQLHFKKGINFCTAIKPLYYVSKCIGLAPFTIQKDNEIVIKKRLLVYNVILFSIQLAICYFFFRDSLAAAQGKTSKASMIPALMGIFFTYSTGFSAITVTAIFLQNNVQELFTQLLDVDQILFSNKTTNYNKMRKVLLGSLIIVTTAVLISLVAGSVLHGSLHYSLGHLLFYTGIMADLQFVCLVCLLQNRFSILNQILNETNVDSKKEIKTTLFTVTPMSTSKPKPIHWLNNTIEVQRSKNAWFQPFAEYMSNNLDEYLRQLREVHFFLCEIASLVNKIYGFHIVLSITHVLINLVWVTFYLLSVIFGGSHTESGLGMDANGFVLLVCVAILLSVSISCGLASGEADATGQIVQQLLLDMTSRNSVQQQLQLFSQQLLHCKVRFTACGLFPLDISLITAVVATVTTYIIILLQFVASEGNGKGNNTVSATAFPFYPNESTSFINSDLEHILQNFVTLSNS